MGRIANTRRITVEDFQDDHRQTVGKLAEVLNFFMDDVTNFANGNVDFENLNQSAISFNVSVDANGNARGTTRIAVTSNQIKGVSVIRVRNLTNSKIYPVSAPLISFTEVGNNLINIDNITGLSPGYNYAINAIIIY